MNMSKEFLEAMIEMSRDMLMEKLAEEECLLADGFEDALIGHTNGGNVVAVYDYNKCVEILWKQGMSPIEAIEYMEYNVVNSYVGEKTPVFVSMK